MVTITEAMVRDALSRVVDPEIPSVPITELGIVADVRIDGAVEIDLMPTFAGCPALDAIRTDVERAILAIEPDAEVRVSYVHAPAWTTDRITETGRRALREFGIAAPGERVLLQIGRPEAVACPYCGSRRTTLESSFGPSPCRTVRYCDACRNPFEGFKAK